MQACDPVVCELFCAVKLASPDISRVDGELHIEKAFEPGRKVSVGHEVLVQYLYNKCVAAGCFSG